jgi:hypothetical protein
MARPRMYDTAEEFDLQVDTYVLNCAMTKEPMLVTDLALFLGFCAVQSLSDYVKNPEFTSSVKRARLIVENGYAKAALKSNSAGAMFLLKCSYGYVDRQVLDVNTKAEITVVMTEDDAKL